MSLNHTIISNCFVELLFSLICLIFQLIELLDTTFLIFYFFFCLDLDAATPKQTQPWHHLLGNSRPRTCGKKLNLVCVWVRNCITVIFDCTLRAQFECNRLLFTPCCKLNLKRYGFDSWVLLNLFVCLENWVQTNDVSLQTVFRESFLTPRAWLHRMKTRSALNLW